MWRVAVCDVACRCVGWGGVVLQCTGWCVMVSYRIIRYPIVWDSEVLVCCGVS